MPLNGKEFPPPTPMNSMPLRFMHPLSHVLALELKVEGPFGNGVALV
jgi:hypothetical protein